MKKFLYFILILIPLFSCKKYKEDPFFSTYSPEGRLCKGSWNCISIMDTVISEIPEFSCILEFDKNGNLTLLKTNSSGELISENFAYAWKSKKNILSFDGVDFEIKSLTWKTIILKSNYTNKVYSFEKWINLDIDKATREDPNFDFPIID